MVAKARYALTDVFRIIDSGSLDRIWFSAKSRSVDAVIKAYAGSASPKTVSDAEKFILSGIRALDDGAFVQSAVQWGDAKCIADVYSVMFDGKPWYVKFRIEENGDLDEISFHPPEKDLVTVSGRKIKGVNGP